MHALRTTRYTHAWCYYTHNAHAHRYLMGWATPRPRLVATSHWLASCVIVSGFRAALDLNAYPLRNLIRPRCAERAKPGGGKPVLIMHNIIIGFFACFHALSLERSRFIKIATFFSCPCSTEAVGIAHKPPSSL